MDCLAHEKLYNQIFDSSIVAIGLTDLAGRYCAVNPAWTAMLGYTEEEAKQLNIADVTPPEYIPESEYNYARLKSGEVDSIRIRRQYLCKSKKRIWADLHVSPFKNDAGKTIGIVGVFVNIDSLVNTELELQIANQELSRSNKELKDLNQKLHTLARRDQLTGLYNRRVLEEVLMLELARSARSKRGFTLAIADLDNFKQINDTYGHPCGDEVLKAVAITLKGGLRAVDIVGRWGGEEFIMLLTETPAESAEVVLNRIRKDVQKLAIECESHKVKLTISIGTCSCDGNCTRDTVIKEADLALYEAKRRGKNRVLNYKDIQA